MLFGNLTASKSRAITSNGECRGGDQMAACPQPPRGAAGQRLGKGGKSTELLECDRGEITQEVRAVTAAYREVGESDLPGEPREVWPTGSRGIRRFGRGTQTRHATTAATVGTPETSAASVTLGRGLSDDTFAPRRLIMWIRNAYMSIAVACFVVCALGGGWYLLPVGLGNLVVSQLFGNDDEDDE